MGRLCPPPHPDPVARSAPMVIALMPADGLQLACF